MVGAETEPFLSVVRFRSPARSPTKAENKRGYGRKWQKARPGRYTSFDYPVVEGDEGGTVINAAHGERESDAMS